VVDAEEERRTTRLQMAGMGLEFAASVVGGMFLGVLLDDWLGTEPWLFLIGTFGGLGSAVIRLVRLSKRLENLSRGARNRR
jgi:ATP synthase protein I